MNTHKEPKKQRITLGSLVLSATNMMRITSTESFNALLGRFSTVELENLLEKFPYFSQAHLLLAKKYQLENDSRFDEQLQLAAFYAEDREFLFELFKEADENEKTRKRENEKTELVIELSPEIEKHEIIEQEVVSEQ